MLEHPDIPICNKKCVWNGTTFGQIDKNGQVLPGGIVRKQDFDSIDEYLTIQGDKNNCFKRYTDYDWSFCVPLSNGSRQGQGKYVWQTGSQYLGTFDKGYMTGYGCWTDKDRKVQKIGYFKTDHYMDGKKYSK